MGLDQSHSSSQKTSVLSLQSLADAKIGMWEYDHAQDQMIWSEGMLSLFGHDPKLEIRNPKAWFSLIHPSDRSKVEKLFLLPEGFEDHTCHLIFRCRHQEGHWIWIQTRGRTIRRDREAKPLRSVGIAFDVSPQQPSELQLTSSHLRTATLIESIPVGVYTFTYFKADGSMRFDFMSEHACYLLGIDRDSVLKDAMVAFDAAVPEDRESLLTTNHALEDGSLFHFEGRFIVRGRLRFIRLQSNRVAEGEWGSQWDGVITDITDDRRADEATDSITRELHQKLDAQAAELAETSDALETTSVRLNYALEASNIGVWDWTIKENRVFYSPLSAFPEPVAPKDASDLLAHWKTFIHPDDLHHVTESFARQIQTSNAYELEYRIKNRNGEFQWILARGRVVERDSLSLPTRIIGTHTDIDARKKASAEKRNLATLIEASSDLIAYANFDGQVTFMNATGRVLMGFAREEPLGDFNIRDAHPDWAYERIMNEALPVAMVEGFWHGDTTFQKRDGTMIDFSQLILVPRDPLTGEAQFIATVCRDITERKRLEKELSRTVAKLEEADRRKDVFLATLAHELRNPLAPITLSTEILKQENRSPDQVNWCIGSISRQTHQLKKLIDDLLDVSRINRGLIRLEKKPIELTMVLEDAVEAFRPQALTKGHQVTLDSSVGSSKVEADPVRLIQVVGNLISNAIKFTPREGRIAVTASRIGRSAFISVHDSGYGIEPENLEKIFGIFSQVKDAASISNEGLGIGLYLAKHLVDLHGGRIEVRSEGKDKGSEFIIQLPLRDEETELPSGEFKAKPLSAAKGLNVLVVDDNLDAQATLTMYLQIQGNQVEGASSGNEALHLAELIKPQLIILDIGLPDMDGYTVCEKIRQKSWGKDLIIIALSGWGQKEDKDKAQLSGFDEHFTKPLDLEALEKFMDQKISH